MFALVESGSITKMLKGNRGITIGDNQYPADIFDKWTESEINAIGIYKIEIDDTNKKDEEWYINTNITYAYDAFTFGYQSNAMDSGTAGADEEFTAYAVSYAVNDDLSISYGYSELDYEGTSTLTDTTQEASAISVSYTMGSMAIAATRADVDNQDGNSIQDGEGYEINVAFTF